MLWLLPTTCLFLALSRLFARRRGALIEDLSLFDVYEGDQVPEGFRSLAFSLRLRASDHTLTPDEVQKVRADVIAKTEKVLGATLRG